MAHLGTVRGSAMLIADGDALERVEYSISIYRDRRGFRQTSGRIVGSVLALKRAFHCQSARLRLDGGEVIEITVRKLRHGDGRAEIDTTGEIPGLQSSRHSRSP
jgi:hypothetical protein